MPLPPPPPALLAGASLFLDLDGTLIEFADRPDAVQVSEGLRDLLRDVAGRLGGRLAVISGRSLDDLDQRLRIDGIALAGSHGLESRAVDGTVTPCHPSADLRAASEEAVAFAKANKLLIEQKPGSVAIHYRTAPDRAEPALRFAGETAARHHLGVQRGSMVVELRMPGADKGSVVRSMMAEPPFMSGSPVVVGDDLTDEHAFEAAVALGGAAVLVGDERPTAALYRLPTVEAVRIWLDTAR